MTQQPERYFINSDFGTHDMNEIIERFKKNEPVSDKEIVLSAVAVLTDVILQKGQRLSQLREALDNFDNGGQKNLLSEIRGVMFSFGASWEEIANIDLPPEKAQSIIATVESKYYYYLSILNNFKDGNTDPLSIFAQRQAQLAHQRGALVQEWMVEDGEMADNNFFWVGSYWEQVASSATLFYYEVDNPQAIFARTTGKKPARPLS